MKSAKVQHLGLGFRKKRCAQFKATSSAFVTVGSPSTCVLDPN